MKKYIWITLGIFLILGIIGNIIGENKEEKKKVNKDYLYSICERLQSSINVVTFKPCRISPSSNGEVMKIVFNDPIDYSKINYQFQTYSPNAKGNDDNIAAPLIIGMARGAGFQKIKLEYGNTESIYNISDFQDSNKKKK